MAGRGGQGERETGTPSAPANVEQNEKKKQKWWQRADSRRGRGGLLCVVTPERRLEEISPGVEH